MRLPRLFLVSVLCFAAFAGCQDDVSPNGVAGGSSGGDGGGGSSGCIEGQAAFCDCDDGSRGVEVCGADGTFGVCDCATPIVGQDDVGTPDAGGVIPDAGGSTDTGLGGLDIAPQPIEPACGPNRYRYDDDDWEEQMYPGEACLDCHRREREGPNFAAAGTVYPRIHDDHGCVGESGITVEITDANGQVHTARTNSTGNFEFRRSFALPYTARVYSSAGESVMIAAQTDGDCNSCHTMEGLEGAPGRMFIP